MKATAQPKKTVPTAGSRDCRPSDKVAAQCVCVLFFHVFILVQIYYTVNAQREDAMLKAEQEECCALRKKKANQKAKQQAGIETGSEDEFQPRANPSVCLLSFFEP